MNKKMIGIIIITAVLLGGCGVFEKFQEAKDQYRDRLRKLIEQSK